MLIGWNHSWWVCLHLGKHRVLQIRSLFFCLESQLNTSTPTEQNIHQKGTGLGFPGGSVVKKLPANAGDMGLILLGGDPTCLKATKPLCLNYWACAQEPESCNSSAHVKTTHPRACALLQEKPPHWEDQAPQLENSPCSPQVEKSLYRAKNLKLKKKI